MRNRVGVHVVGVALAAGGMLWAAEVPVAVSPGDASKLMRVADPCPTFNWGGVPGAQSYELVVYLVSERAEEAEPVLRQTVPGTANGWTPSLDRCLKRGQQYAWSVRAIGKKRASRWSSPSLFQVAAGPSEAEFEAALQIVRQYVTEAGVEEFADSVGFAPDEAPGESSSAAGLQGSDPPTHFAPAAGDSDLVVNGAAVVTTATFLGAVTASQRECPGALGLFSDRYVDCGNGSVRDNNTGLYWLKDGSCADLEGTDSAGKGDWDTAEAAAAVLADGTCGLTDGSQPGDWRQPTAREFCSAWVGSSLNPCPTSAAPDSLLHFPTPSPMINKPNPFVDVEASLYWSSSRPILGDTAWLADLDSAHVFVFNRDLGFYIWPVRFGQ